MRVAKINERGVPEAIVKKYHLAWQRKLEKINAFTDEERKLIRSMRKFKKNAMNKLKRKYGLLGHKYKTNYALRAEKKAAKQVG